MAIVGQIIIESRRYSGWLDPRYPIGFWQGALTLTGDASGGALAIDLLFQQANGGAFRNSQLYSVERFAAETDDESSRDAQIRAVNMGGPDNVGFLQGYRVIIDSVAGTGKSALATEAMNLVPWFVGAQRTAGVSASVSLVADNANGIAFHFEAEGYRWSPRSVLVDGGPQRPPTGLYRQ